MASNRLGRRRFLKYLGIAGAGAAIGGAFYLNNLPRPSSSSVAQPPAPGIAPRRPLIIAEPKNAQNYIPDEYIEFIRWLQSVSDKVAGKEIRVALETEVATRALFRNKVDFDTATGITSLYEFDVYQVNIAKTLLAVTTRSPTYDVMNIDVAYTGTFKEHLIPIEELTKQFPDLTYPKLNLEDYERTMLNASGKYPPDLSFAPYNKTYPGTLVQLPQETPLMIRFYRKDLYQAEKRSLPATWDEYYEDVKHFDQFTNGLYGTVLMAARSPSVVMEWHNHLYSFGGKLWEINEEGITSAIDSEEAIASLENYVRLVKYAEPASKYSGWVPAADTVQAARAVNALNFTEFAAEMDIPGESAVIGKIGFDKNPKGPAGHSHHYSGGGLGVPKYSRNPGAAWLFIQWATVAATQVILSLDLLALAVPTRKSVFSHPEVERLISQGTIRHFSVVRDILKTGTINFKPGFPNWDAAEGVLMTNLNKAIMGEMTARKALKDAKAHIDTLGKFAF